ncbi:MAG: 30S ribosomal protein S1, partial [Acidobacteria bacterium]|nr:30S ribosomal protein S1 [Acidobacteriota bacterium]
MTNEVTNETESSTANENSVAAEQTSAAATPTDSVEETATRAAATDESQQPNQVQQGQENAPVSQDATAISASTQNDASSSATSDESKGAGEMDFGAILKQFEQEQTIYHTGELVEGKVVGTSDRGVLIDFGYKSEGIVPIEEFMTPDGELNVKQGDAVEVVIRSIHSGDAPPMLSRLDAVSRKSWAEIEEAFNSETPITGYVIDKTKGGLRVDLNGVEAFLPGSQIDSRPIRNLDVYVGQDIEAKIIKFSRKRNNIVLSRKVLTDEVVNAQKAETLSQIEEGYVVEGTIKNLTEYGAFVDIGGIDGLLHVTDMSWNRMMNPNQLFKVGDHIQVKILKLDRERDKVALGYKQLLADPWSTVTEVYPVNSKLIGKVSSVTDYGAFIELEPGVEGLVHVSEMSWSKRSKSPKKLLNAGEEVDVQVLGIDTNERRISLGMKQLQENPWETILDRYHIGSTVRGRVRNLTDFGAFVEVEEGVDGLVHVSDISHSKKIKHPKDVLRRDQEVEAVVTSIDTRGRRMSLSIKELTPSAWEQFITTHKPGDVVRGKISRFAGFGVFVQLADELEGLCHISELSDERVERPEDVVAIGQEMDFKILRIEHEEQKIGLSARAVGKVSEEPSSAADSKMYSTEAKGGMASLGELMNLKRGGKTTAEEPTADEPKLSKKERKA